MSGLSRHTHKFIFGTTPDSGWCTRSVVMCCHKDQATWVGGELWSGFCKLLITLHRWFCNEQKSSYCVCLWLWKTDCREHFRGLSSFKVVGRTPNLINCFYFLVFVSKKPSLNWRVCTLQCTIFRVMLIVLSIFVMH